MRRLLLEESCVNKNKTKIKTSKKNIKKKTPVRLHQIQSHRGLKLLDRYGIIIKEIADCAKSAFPLEF